MSRAGVSEAKADDSILLSKAVRSYSVNVAEGVKFSVVREYHHRVGSFDVVQNLPHGKLDNFLNSLLMQGAVFSQAPRYRHRS